ncbi:MAG: hypothetical protein WD638_00445 [Nitriliruptoraceae bacterium]
MVAGVVLLTVTMTAAAQSTTAGAIGLTTAALIYGLIRTADRRLLRADRIRQQPPDGPGTSAGDEARRRWRRRVAAVALVAGAATLSVLYVWPSDRAPSDDPGAGAPLPERAVIAATYHGTADHDDGCGCWELVDSVTIPAATLDETAAKVQLTAVTADELRDAVVAAATRDGWEAMLFNDALSLTRHRQVRFPSGGTGLAWLLATHRLAIAAPSAWVGDLPVLLRFDTDSLLRLTAPDKAVSATDPAFDRRDLLAQGREQVDVPIVEAWSAPATPSGGPFADVTIDVLHPWARIGAVGPALARTQTGGLAAIVLVGTLGLIGVTGKPPMFAMVRSAISELRAWREARREEQRMGAASDDRGYL